MALLLALVKTVRGRIRAVEEDGWHLGRGDFTSTLHRTAVGIYGCGLIGRVFVEMLRPFGATMTVYDPFAKDLPEGCLRAESLDELFRTSEAVVIHAGLTDETRGSVNAARLAMLPDNGIVVNTARGGIVDQAALFAELEKGRLLAGIDVLDPDRPLPEGHPARRWPNALFTGHTIGTWGKGGRERESLAPWHEVCLENLKRFRDGQEPRFRMDRERYLLST
jgi:phosphoglycerate dehydrogenase-like enzyme